MKNLETFVLDVLVSVPLDVGLEELIGGLISLDWVSEIVLGDLFGLSQERSNGFDARGTLEILAIDQLFDVFVEVFSLWTLSDSHLLENSHQDGSVSFEVPVLVDNLVDYSSLENLVCFVNEKVHEIVHIVDFFCIFHVFSAVLRQDLFSNHGDEEFDVLVLCELDVLFRELHAHFDLVEHWSQHGNNQCLSLPNRR